MEKEQFSVCKKLFSHEDPWEVPNSRRIFSNPASLKLKGCGLFGVLGKL
jgi:hypothetical protein